MPVTDFLERNAKLYPNEVALVELNPDEKDTRRTSWKEYELIQLVSNRIDVKLLGGYLTKRQTVLQTCCLVEE